MSDFKRLCPECGSGNLKTERRPNGESHCMACGYRDLTSEFDRRNKSKSHSEKDQEITRLKKALEIANEAIGFYADVTNNPKQYMRQGYLVYNLKKKIFVDGGEKAREAQKQIKEVMERK